MDSLSGATLVKADGSSVSADSALAGKVPVLYKLFRVSRIFPDPHHLNVA
jgi:hypothetical protein